MKRPVLVIDPRIQFGQVCIARTRVPADAVAGCVSAGDSVDAVASDYQVSRDEVLLACLWYGWSCQNSRHVWDRKVAAAWEEWLDEAVSVLGGHKPGPLRDPPNVV